MKKNLITSIAVIMIIICMTPISAAAHTPLTVNFNGVEMEFDSNPIIMNSRTMIPVRAIAERLGAEVGWNDKTREVIIEQDNSVITLQINNKVVDVDGMKIEIDAPPVIIGNRTLVPLRFISENFGAEVLWDGDTYTVDINRAIVDVYTNKEDIKVGDNFEVIIEVAEGYDIFGYQIDGRFNKDVAEIQSIRLTNYIDGMVFKNQHDNEEGKFTIIKTKLGKVQGASGKGELVAISFKIKGEGDFDLNLGDNAIKLVSSTTKYIPVKTNDYINIK